MIAALARVHPCLTQYANKAKRIRNKDKDAEAGVHALGRQRDETTLV